MRRFLINDLVFEEKGTELLADFLDQVYLPWSKANKKSRRDDSYTAALFETVFRESLARDFRPARRTVQKRLEQVCGCGHSCE